MNVETLSPLQCSEQTEVFVGLHRIPRPSPPFTGNIGCWRDWTTSGCQSGLAHAGHVGVRQWLSL